VATTCTQPIQTLVISGTTMERKAVLKTHIPQFD
jgi:hypothetical protein